MEAAKRSKHLGSEAHIGPTHRLQHAPIVSIQVLYSPAGGTVYCGDNPSQGDLGGKAGTCGAQPRRPSAVTSGLAVMPCAMTLSRIVQAAAVAIVSRPGTPAS
jgi:hypothetical protein